MKIHLHRHRQTRPTAGFIYIRPDKGLFLFTRQPPGKNSWTSTNTSGAELNNRVTKGYYVKEIAEGLLTEVAVKTAYVDGFAIGCEPELYDREKVREELGFIDENGVGSTENQFRDIF